MKQKSTEAPIPSVPDVPQPQVVSSSKSSGTRRKSLGRRSRITKPEFDLDADDKKFIKVVSDEDSEDEAPYFLSLSAGFWLFGGISTSLGEINAMYMMDQSTKHFTTLREILCVGGFLRSDYLKSTPLSGSYGKDVESKSWRFAKDVVGNDMTTDVQLIQDHQESTLSGKENKMTMVFSHSQVL
ncbi:hypothetical protein Tco_1448383 [Tanacetum coccineum]